MHVPQEPTATQDLCSQIPTAGMPSVQEIGGGASRNLKTIDGCTSTLHQTEIRSLSRQGVGRFMGSCSTARIFGLVRLARTQASPGNKLQDVMKKPAAATEGKACLAAGAPDSAEDGEVVFLGKTHQRYVLTRDYTVLSQIAKEMRRVPLETFQPDAASMMRFVHTLRRLLDAAKKFFVPTRLWLHAYVYSVCGVRGVLRKAF